MVAGLDLGRGWLVLWRHAAHSIDDAAVLEDEAIIRAALIVTRRQIGLQQGLIQEIAGIIAGKGAAGSIGAL